MFELSAEPLVGLKQGGKTLFIAERVLSAEPLVGLKPLALSLCRTMSMLSAEPLVGLKPLYAIGGTGSSQSFSRTPRGFEASSSSKLSSTVVMLSAEPLVGLKRQPIC